MLHNQPFAYGGQENPLLCTHTAKSAGPCNTIRLGHDPEALLARLRNRCSRKKIRRNLRRMEEEIGPVELVRASSQEEVTTTLNALRAHKSQLGVVRPDRTLFANPGVVRFLDRAAVFRNFDVDSGVEYFYLRAGEHIVATFGCAVSGKRAAGMFISIDADNFAHCSPGEVLITRLLEHYSERGFRALDLGVGSGEYKRRWCHDNEPLFDSIVAANWRGQLVASPLNRLILMAKNAVKASDRLSRIVQGAMIVLSGRA